MKNFVLISLGLLVVLGCNLEDGNTGTGQSKVMEFDKDLMRSAVGTPGAESRNITSARNSSDPQARWFNHRMYVYTSCDLNTGSTSDNYPMKKTYVYSWTYGESKFTDHGSIMSEANIPWAAQKNHLWAPDCEYINGKYVLFMPCIKSGTSNLSQIGVAISNSPTRGFAARPNPINIEGWHLPNDGYASDPGICKQADGDGLFLFYCDGDWETPQKGRIRVAILSHDLDNAYDIGSAIKWSSLPSAWRNDGDLYLEGPSVTYNSTYRKYYMIFSVKHDNNAQQILAYATSDKLWNEFEYKGIVMNPIPDEEEWTNHGSITRGNIMEYYLVYHYGKNTYSGNKVKDNKRQACIKMFNMRNGSIPTITHDGGH